MAPDIPLVICEPWRILCFQRKYVNTIDRHLFDTFFVNTIDRHLFDTFLNIVVLFHLPSRSELSLTRGPVNWACADRFYGGVSNDSQASTRGRGGMDQAAPVECGRPGKREDRPWVDFDGKQ